MRAIVGILVLAWAVAAQGVEEEVRLATDPALSPDGKTLVFAWRGDLWRAASTGGRVERLTSHPARESDPHFSPDGAQIAFVSTRTGNTQTWLMDPSGGAPTQLTFHSEGSRVEGWFPSGGALLLRAARDHFWYDPARLFFQRLDTTAAPVLLFDDHGWGGRVSPDGRHLLFVREGVAWWRKGYRGSQAAQLWTYDTASRRFERLSAGAHNEQWPSWTADGRGCWYVSDEDGTLNLWHRDLATGARTQRTRFVDDGVLWPAVSRDGSVCVFRRGFDLWRLELREGAEPSRLRLVHVGDRIHALERRDMLAQATQVAFTDDGREIAFIAGGDLWVMDTELREPVQVTDTPEEERDPVFSPDFSSIVFASDRGGRPDLYRVTRADEKLWWWQNRAFPVERLTNDADEEREPRFTPDGRIAFLSLRGDLWTMAPDGTDTRIVLRSWNDPSYDFSPDGKWVAYAVDDTDFNRDVWIRPADGSGTAVNVSRHPDRESNPVWSPDGRLLAFTGQRAHRESDIHYVWLRKQDDDKDQRDRTLEKALEKMKGREKAQRKPSPPKGGDGTPGEGQPGGAKPPKEPDPQPKLPDVRIDFEGIADRIRSISIPDANESGLFWAPDSKTLAFRARIEGKEGLYTVTLPDDLKPKLLTGQAGTDGRWLKEGDQIVWLFQGRPASLTARGQATTYAFRVAHEVDVRALHAAVFDQAWRIMRDRYYDGRLNNRDWDAVRAKYRSMATAALTTHELDQVVDMMLGELNGSHLGFRASDPEAWTVDGWRPVTPHFGARFEPVSAGPGLRVRDVVAGTPASKEQSRLQPGDVVLAVDGQPLEAGVAYATAFHGPLERDYLLRVRGPEGMERDVVIRPTTYGEVRAHLYEAWVEESRRRVDELSGGRFGYLHVRGMNWPSFERFEAELYKVGHGKDGLVIDVRNNGGGFTADHLLTCLTQPVHAITVGRGGGPGYPQDRMVYARWHKPVVVLCNQNSFSNAEIFSHAVKTLQRGRIVGVPTAGGVISTGGARIHGFASIRVPLRGWFLRDTGEDMELNGCLPHVTLWPEPEQLPAAKDPQLRRAVDLLTEDTAAWEARGKPGLRYASERRGD